MAILKNEYIEANISNHGAELHSLIHNGIEYIWQADKTYWARHAPFLFPIVGKVFNNEYHIGKNTYTLPQHGFARDMDFQLIESTNTSASFQLDSNDTTLKSYPYLFSLRITYTLTGRTLSITSTVTNTDTQDIYFQLGAHPAFKTVKKGRFLFTISHLQILHKNTPVRTLSIKRPSKDGYILPTSEIITLSDGLLPITPSTFDSGALILEDTQCDTIRLLDENMNTHLTLSSNAPIFGIWSPEHKNAPFVCIEPWFGRADDANLRTDFTSKPFINRLSPGATFPLTLSIEI